MGFLGLGKKKEVVDLGERYKRQQAKLAEIKAGMINSDREETSSSASQTQSSPGIFSFFNAVSSSARETSEEYPASSENGEYEDKRKKLAKHLATITNKLEDLSNQIYHLQQRIELLERKAGVKGFS